MTANEKRQEFDFRWGVPAIDKARHGGSDVPGFVLRNYHKLGVTPTEMMLIIHLSAYHFNSAQGEARPSLKTISDMMGFKKDASVRNHLKSLEKRKLVKVERPKGKCSIYDFYPLSARCLSLDQDSEESPTDTVPHSSGVPHSEGRAVPHSDGTEDKEYKMNNTRASATPPNGGQQTADVGASAFKVGDTVTWPRKIRGTYGCQEYLRGEVVRLTAKQVVVSVTQADGEVIERSVNPASLLAGHVDMPPVPAPDPVEIPDNAPEHIALIATWWNSIPQSARPYTKDGKPPYSEEAQRAAYLARQGYTRQHIAQYIASKKADAFWADKPMTFKHVADHMPAFVDAHKLRGGNREHGTLNPADPDCPMCDGKGVYSYDVPYGDPRFGKTEVCACRKPGTQEAAA